MPLSRKSQKEIKIFNRLKEALIEFTENLFTANFGLEISEKTEIRQTGYTALSIKAVSASIIFEGDYNGVFRLIVEDSLAKTVVNAIGLGKLTSEDEIMYMEDAVGELLNTITGNITNNLMEKNISININPPMTFIHNDSALDLKDLLWIYRVETSDGVCLIGIS